MNSEHEERHDDLAAYAVGALPPPEVAALEQHLAECEACRARLRWLEPAVDLLPASVEQRTPPPALRERLMATVRAEADEPAGNLPRGRESRWERLPRFALRPAIGFAAAVLLVGGAFAGYALRGNPEDESTLIEVRAASPDLASATLERQDGSATLHVDELPGIRRDEVYEVWVQRAGVMEPASTFVPRDDGTAEAAVGPLEGAEGVFVTREPRGGSERPTTAPVLEAPLE